MQQWEYLSITVQGWTVVDWSSLTALNSDEIQVGHHLINVLKTAGKNGWEMTAAVPEGDETRYWFKRAIQS